MQPPTAAKEGAKLQWPGPQRLRVHAPTFARIERNLQRVLFMAAAENRGELLGVASSWGQQLPAALSIDFLAVADSNDVHDQRLVLNLIENPKGTLPDSILLIRIRELLDAYWSGIVSGCQNSTSNPLAVLLPNDRIESFGC